MSNRKKVLFFTSPEVGGAERMTVTIAKMLDPQLYEVKFYVIGKEKGNIVNFIPSNYPVGLVKIINIFDFTTIKLWLLMKKEKPNIVFSSLIYLSIRVIAAARLIGGVRVIIRNNIGLSVVTPLNLWLCKHTFPKADVIIAQQDEMRDEIIKTLSLCKNKVKTLCNPIDTQLINLKSQSPSPYNGDKAIKYVWTGRVSKEKGQDILIKAFAKVHQFYPNSKLFFIGKYKIDDYYQSLLSLTKDLGLRDSVRFVGFDPNPYRWVKYSECFVQPSRLEGLPNALIEAMFLGKPVVATRCIPVIDRIVDNGYNGYVVDPEDVDALADAMISALKLTNFTMTYKGSSKNDFIKLFE